MVRTKRTKKRNSYRLPLAIVLGVVFLVAVVEVYLSGCCAAPSQNSVPSVEEKTTKYPKAPELSGIVGYINTGSDIKLGKLREEKKVVLVDFWTYTCINCQRTIPYLNAWYEKYRDKGLEIVGVHSPEFEFEKDYNNVRDAVARFGIKYPVVQDNDFKTWKSYGNNFWPRKYLIDVDGFIRYDHIGEGAYDETERFIQELLDERAKRMNLGIEIDKNISTPSGAVEVNPIMVNTPEIYLGYGYARSPLGNPENFQPEKTFSYVLPDSREWTDNLVYLGGKWQGNVDSEESRQDGAKIGLRYSARNVNIVAGGSGNITVRIDGEIISGLDEGPDVAEGVARIDANKLYNLVLSKSYGVHELLLTVSGDVKIYTFTFG